jgi:Tol biopolymer transport system component
MAIFMLAGTLSMAGCGSSTAPASGPTGLPPLPKQQPAAQAPAPNQAQAPDFSVGSTADAAPPAGPAASTVSGDSAPAASTTSGSAVSSGNLGAATGSSGLGLKGGMEFSTSDRIVFFSDRQPSEGLNDIYVFDPLQDTVLSIVGVNTKDNETNPRMSDNGKWLVFQRGVGSGSLPVGNPGPNGHINQDILLYNMDAKLVNTLHNLNTENFDEYEPDVSDDGCKIVYVSNQGPGFDNSPNAIPEIRLYDVTTGDNWEVPGANRNFKDVSWPTISANGLKIAYGASILFQDDIPNEDNTGTPTGGAASTGGLLAPGESNIYIYDVAHGTQITPPFVNTAFDEYDPELCADGSRMLFVTNRWGAQQIAEVNFDTGFIDNLSFLNHPHHVGEAANDMQHPRYLGSDTSRIVFQVKDTGNTVPIFLQAYNRVTAMLDTLPVANDLLFNQGLRAPQPEIPAIEVI